MNNLLKQKIKYNIADLTTLLNRNVFYYLIADILFYCTSNIVNSFLSILIAYQIASDRLDIVGIVFTSYEIAFAISSLFAEKITKRLKKQNKGNIIAISYTISGILTAIIGFCSHAWTIAIFFALIGLFNGIAYPIKNSNYSKIVNNNYTEKAWGVLTFFNTLIPAIFLVLVGFLSSKSTLPIIFVISGLQSILSGFFFGKVNFNQTEPEIKKFAF
jgi:MFS family permease